MTERELANLAQRAQIQSAGISATRLHVALPIYLAVRQQLYAEQEVEPEDEMDQLKLCAAQAVAEADQLMRALGLIS